MKLRQDRLTSVGDDRLGRNTIQPPFQFSINSTQSRRKLNCRESDLHILFGYKRRLGPLAFIVSAMTMV
jgi:hypothetical protein